MAGTVQFSGLKDCDKLSEEGMEIHV